MNTNVGTEFLSGGYKKKWKSCLTIHKNVLNLNIGYHYWKIGNKNAEIIDFTFFTYVPIQLLLIEFSSDLSNNEQT